MNKTPIGRRYEIELGAINDQLCFDALIHHEFSEIIEQHAASDPSQNTFDIFPTNPHASRIFRQAKQLPVLAVASAEATAKMAALYGCEHLFAYLEEIQAFRAELVPSPEDHITDDKIEVQLLERLKGWSKDTPEVRYFRTVGYLRHMRNSFAHAHAKGSSSWKTFAATHSHELDKFWTNGKTDLGDLKFRAVPAQTLTFETAYALINLERICLRELDRMFASTLNSRNVLKSIFKEVLTKAPNIKTDSNKLARKARIRFYDGYGEKLSELTVLKAASEFLDC